MAEKDYIAQLFRVRRERYDISDDIYWGWFNPDNGSIAWEICRHADADGMGTFANILRPLGFPCAPLPVCNETEVPNWLEIIKAGKKYPRPAAPKKINWKNTYAYAPNRLHIPEVAYLTQIETNALKAKAVAEKLSKGNIAFSALSRVIAQHLIEGGNPFYWFLGVNIRGATTIKNEL